MKNLLAGVVAIALAGCASLPQEQEIKKADYGKKPSDHELIVKAYYNKTLSHPEDALYESISKPVRYWIANGIDGALYGYLVCVNINTTTFFGAYTGYRNDAFIIKNDNIVKYVEDGIWWGEILCKDGDVNRPVEKLN